MKFMKLGSKPDTFVSAEEYIRTVTVSSEVASDLILQVKGCRYMLHKFPLLSKCLRLQQLCSESPESSQTHIVQLPDFPGGVDAFEICAKFCYGITVTVSAYNVVAVRCASEYLQMSEDVEKGNLIYKLDVFLNSCILQGWRDSIVTLQSTVAFAPWSEGLGITARCVESVAARVMSCPTKANLSRSYSRRGVRDDASSCYGGSKGWWAEDIADLGIDLYWRIMIAVRSGGKLPPGLIGEALKIYASRWLPSVSRHGNVKSWQGAEVEAAAGGGDDSAGEVMAKRRVLLETIVNLLPAEKGAVTCGFLLKLLKAANVFNASSSSKTELARRVGIQLENARVGDLLIPSPSPPRTGDTMYDVDIVMNMLEQFMLQAQSPPTSPSRSKGGLGGFERRRRSRSAEHVDLEFLESRRSSSASHGSKLKVAKLVDRYLQEIAKDVNLPLSKLIALAETIPDFARTDHDDLYRAIDIYLKAHPALNKSERKRLCRVLDCKKLSVEVCMHAAQNELLPLRVVVQVLFFEQARAAMAGGHVAELPSNIKALLAAHGDDISKATATFSTTTSVRAEDQWSISGLKSPKSSKLSTTLRMKLAEDGDLEENDLHSDAITKGSKLRAFCALPTRPKRMLSKLWPINRSASEKN